MAVAILIGGNAWAPPVEGGERGDGRALAEHDAWPGPDDDGMGRRGEGGDARNRGDRGDFDRQGEARGPGQPGGRDGGEHRGGRSRPMSDQEIDEAYAIVEVLKPELVSELQELRDSDPRRMREVIERRFPAVRYLVGLKQRDPRMYDLRVRDIQLTRQTRDLARRIGEARDTDQKREADDLKEQLEEAVTEHFEVRQKVRERELELLRERLEQMEEELEDRADDRRDLIEERVEELIGAGRGPRF